MKLLNHFTMAAVMFGIAAGVASAQTNVTPSNTQPVRDGQVIVPEKPTANDANAIADTNIRPDRPERPALPPEVQSRVERFKIDARTYLAQQEELKKQLQGANDQERAVIREKVKELREQWLERAREMRKDYKERQQELAEKLTEYRELLDELRSTAVQESGGRKRRGED